MDYGPPNRPTLYTDVGERILLARRRAGLSQRAFGERLGVSHAAVSDLERGKSKPNLDNLSVIAERLGVPLSQLIDGVTEAEERRRQRPAVAAEHGPEGEGG